MVFGRRHCKYKKTPPRKHKQVSAENKTTSKKNVHTVNSLRSFSGSRLSRHGFFSHVQSTRWRKLSVWGTVFLVKPSRYTPISRNCPGRNYKVPDEQSKQQWRYAFGAFCGHTLGRIFTLNGNEWHLWWPNNFKSGSRFVQYWNCCSFDLGTWCLSGDFSLF